MVDPLLRILDIKVAGTIDTSPSAPASAEAQRAITTERETMQPLALAKLIVLVGCVSLLFAFFLAALADFQPDIVPFQARVGMFLLRYTMPTCFFQLVVFWLLYFIRKR